MLRLVTILLRSSAAALVAVTLSACAVDGPLIRLGACLSAASSGQRAGAAECDLGSPTYLVALPRNTTTDSLKPLGLSKEILFALEASSSHTPWWCSVTTKAGGLPTHGASESVNVQCLASSVDMTSPALLQAQVIRIHMERRESGRARVESVEPVQRP